MPRKKPFSNKQKKQQLQQKREKKKLQKFGIINCTCTSGTHFLCVFNVTDDEPKPRANPLGANKNDSDISESDSEQEVNVIRLHQQPTAKPKPGYNPNKYNH